MCIKNEILKFIKNNTNSNISIEEEISDNLSIKDTIKDESINILESVIIKESSIDLYNIIKNNLNELEYLIIKMTFGIRCREYKQKEIAKILDIPQYKVSRVKSRSLLKLRDYINNLN